MSPPSKPLIVVVVVVVLVVVVVAVLVLAVHTHVLVVSGAVSCGVVGREQRAEGRELIGFLNMVLRGAPEIFPLTNLVFWTNQGGGLTESQLFCKIVKTKLTFVNGQKCDETHNT